MKHSIVDKISIYLLQEGNQDTMRALYEKYFRLLTEFNNNEEVIQNLGYISQ